MSTFKTFFSDDFASDALFELTGTANYARLPNILGSTFKFQARSTNKGSFMLGPASGTIYYEIEPGDETEWLKIAGNRLGNWFYRNVSGSNERLIVWSKI
jgi:hypothetical protein